MIEHPKVCGLFNLGTGTARSFYDLAAATFDAMGVERNITFVEMPESLRPNISILQKQKWTSFVKQDIKMIFIH